MYSLHMTTDTVPKPEPMALARTVFILCLIVSVLANVWSGWEADAAVGAAIGAWLPIALMLAEQLVTRLNLPWWLRLPIAAVAIAAVVWSGTHLAELAAPSASYEWMKWLFPISVDVLMFLALVALLVLGKRNQDTREAALLLTAQEAPALPAVQEAPLPVLSREASPVWEETTEEEAPLLSSPVEEAPLPESLSIPAAVERALSGTPRQEPSSRDSVFEETVTETKTTTRRATLPLDHHVERMREAVERGDVKPTISAAKTYLGVAHPRAKAVIEKLEIAR